MISLIGALIGFAGSAVPSVIDHFKTKEDNKTKLEILKVGGELVKEGKIQDLAAWSEKATDSEHSRLISHDISLQQSKGFFGGLSKSVRPVITYAFFSLFVAVKVSSLLVALESNDVSTAIASVWDPETSALFASVMAFWFGGRAIDKYKRNSK